ncbi:MAG: DNA-3-methyladenine glycosylase 2 family protein [Eggerthellaceae bacterium]|nr:DNA-3-methyladenine glycosylase 2 family protein [Eggerthellaceae bacterium]
MEIIHIDDDLDLEKVRASGQCFRIQAEDGGSYRLVFQDHVMHMRDAGEGAFEVSCTPDEFWSVWAPYLDLDRSYSSVRARAANKSSFLDRTMEFGRGLRVLNQDPWEMLITFIISQRKSMPAIATAVEALCASFGEEIEPGIFAFPTPEALARATDAELRACGLGYRAPYVAAAARMVATGELDLDACAKLDDEALLDALMGVHGVGKKVANCVALFGFGRTGAVPVDVWIGRAMDAAFEGEDPFAQFGQDAGILQQYVFYYVTQNKGEFK